MLDAVDTVGVVSGGSTLQMVQVNKLSIKAETRKSSAFSMHFTIKESRSQYFSGFPCVQKSSNPAHRAIWARISASPRSLVDNYVAGLELVEGAGGAAAMLMEETAARYVAARECDKYTVGHLEDRHYAFAFRKGRHILKS